MRKTSLAKLIEPKENYDLRDIWRVRNTKSKRFTFAQKNFSGFIQRRLDSMFISNTLQECIAMTEILTSISTDHSPVQFSLSKEKGCLRGKLIWKFNSSLTEDQDYITKIKKIIRSLCTANKCLQLLTKMGTLKIWSSKIYY